MNMETRQRSQQASVSQDRLSNHLADACEGVMNDAHDVEQRLSQLLNRIAGPHPTADGIKTEPGASKYGGLLGTCDTRLTETKHIFERSRGLLEDRKSDGLGKRVG